MFARQDFWVLFTESFPVMDYEKTSVHIQMKNGNESVHQMTICFSSNSLNNFPHVTVQQRMEEKSYSRPDFHAWSINYQIICSVPCTTMYCAPLYNCNTRHSTTVQDPEYICRIPVIPQSVSTVWPGWLCRKPLSNTSQSQYLKEKAAECNRSCIPPMNVINVSKLLNKKVFWNKRLLFADDWLTSIAVFVTDFLTVLGDWTEDWSSWGVGSASPTYGWEQAELLMWERNGQ